MTETGFQIECAKCGKWTDAPHVMFSPNVRGMVCPTCGELERVESIAPLVKAEPPVCPFCGKPA